MEIQRIRNIREKWALRMIKSHSAFTMSIRNVEPGKEVKRMRVRFPVGGERSRVPPRWYTTWLSFLQVIIFVLWYKFEDSCSFWSRSWIGEKAMTSMARSKCRLLTPNVSLFSPYVLDIHSTLHCGCSSTTTVQLKLVILDVEGAGTSTWYIIMAIIILLIHQSSGCPFLQGRNYNTNSFHLLLARGG